MAFRFDLKDVFACSALDEEGFRCVLRPNHAGPHAFGRCDYTSASGHRCFLPPGHPGDHAMPWYDTDSRPGDRHTMDYEGVEDDCRQRAADDTSVFRAHGWVAVESDFRPWWAWRFGPTAGLAKALTAPRGRLGVVYEYRPRDAADAD